MSHLDNVIDIRRPVMFMIDGRTYQTRVRRQRAGDVLRLAGLDPARYDLGERRAHRPRPVRYAHDDVVEIHRWTRFVAIEDRCDAV